MLTGLLRRDEGGTSLLVVALSLVVLLGFAAIAVDAAGAWSLRRQQQNGADTGAVAGAVMTASKTKSAAITDATDEIIRISYETLDPAMTAAQWEAEWVACADAAKPAKFTEPGVTTAGDTVACISFTDNLDEVRVTTPIVAWDTTFATVIGFNQIDTRATAEVDLDLDVPGGVLPFGRPASAAGGEICLKTGANPQNTAPCDGPDQGNFGFLDFTQFGNTDFGTTKTCTGGGTSRLEVNIARGIDHGLGTWDTDPALGPVTPNHELPACHDGNFSAFPHQVDVQTGNVAQVLDDGFTDGDGLGGKLEQGGNRIPVRGELLDNTTLRSFLTGTGSTFCTTTIGHAVANHDDMAACLNAFAPGPWAGPVLFSESVADAPRFGWVPHLWEDFGPGTTTMTIRDILPIYVQTTFWKCTATGCDLEWDPGETPGPGPNNVRIEASTALAIPKGALPDSIIENAPGTAAQIDYLISK